MDVLVCGFFASSEVPMLNPIVLDYLDVIFSNLKKINARNNSGYIFIFSIFYYFFCFFRVLGLIIYLLIMCTKTYYHTFGVLDYCPLR